MTLPSFHKAWVVLGASVMLAILAGCEGLQIRQALRSGEHDWTTFGGSMERQNLSGQTVRPPLSEVWQYDAGSGLTATPLVKDSVVVLCTLKGELHVANVHTGKRIGYISLGGAIAGTPVWNGSALYVPIATGSETIESIDLSNGSKNWVAKFGPTESSPLLFQKRLYVTTLKGELYAINVIDGSKVWRYETSAEDAPVAIRSSPATDGSNVFFGADDGSVFAVNADSGTLTWKFKASQSVFASPIVVRGRVIVGSLDGTVYCLSADAGKLLWLFDAKSPVFGAASSDGSTVFVGTADGHCFALDLNDGTKRWSFQAKSVINSAPLVTPELVCVGSLDKTLYVLDIRTGREVGHFESAGRIKVSPVIWNGLLLVTSEDSYLTALKQSP